MLFQRNWQVGSKDKLYTELWLPLFGRNIKFIPKKGCISSVAQQIFSRNMPLKLIYCLASYICTVTKKLNCHSCSILMYDNIHAKNVLKELSNGISLVLIGTCYLRKPSMSYFCRIICKYILYILQI